MMRTIGRFSVPLCLGLLLTSSTVIGAELGNLSECGCGASTAISAAGCDSCGDITCEAPGCDTADCDLGDVDLGDVDLGDVDVGSCDPSGYETCGHIPCCTPWTVSAETMFLRRSDAGSVPLILGQNTGATLLNANNLEYNHTAVPRLRMIYDDCCSCWGFGIGYFGTDSWSTSGSGSGDDSPVLVGPGFAIGSTAPGTVYQFDSSTTLRSGEVNIRRQWTPCLTWVAGFRWIELSDELNALATAPQQQSIYSVDADNNLYGFQIGFDAILLQPTPRFHIDSIVRAGILSNSADQTTRAPFVGNVNGFVDQVGADASETSFLAELGIRGVYQVTNAWAVFGGYQALWLDGLALAPEQIPLTNMASPGSASVETDGELFFHGATVGIQMTF